MEVFSFITAVFVILISSQYGLYWLMILVAGIAAFMSKEKKVFVILGLLALVMYLIQGTTYQSYGMYVAAVATIVYLVMNRNSGEEDDVGGMGDQYGDLHKGLGG